MKDKLKKPLDEEALSQVAGGAFEIKFEVEDYYKACDQPYTCPYANCGHYGTGIAMYPVNAVSNGREQAGYALKCQACGGNFIGFADGSTKYL